MVWVSLSSAQALCKLSAQRVAHLGMRNANQRLRPFAHCTTAKAGSAELGDDIVNVLCGRGSAMPLGQARHDSAASLRRAGRKRDNRGSAFAQMCGTDKVT